MLIKQRRPIFFPNSQLKIAFLFKRALQTTAHKILRRYNKPQFTHLLIICVTGDFIEVNILRSHRVVW